LGKEKIDIIIITYNRPDEMLDLCRNLSTLSFQEELLNKIIIVNNCSSADYSEVCLFIQEHPTVAFQYLIAPENLGVAKGRNYALQFSQAELVIMLDDDCILQNTDALKNIVDVFNLPTLKKTAVVSFKVLYYSTNEIQASALPHKKFNQYKDLPFFETYFYAGGAHAIRRSVMMEVGDYSPDFFYGMEEYDLSYRILNAGYRIVYSDKVVMLHKESPLGRVSNWQKLQMMWVNKSIVAWRYLPFYYFLTTAILWSIFYLTKSKFKMKGFISGWNKIFNIPKMNKRAPISKNIVQYLHVLKARLWY
jgi:GT2 family glycosyltransferase